MAYVFGVVLPALEPYRGERPFALAVREVVGHDPTGLALYRTRELVYYLGYAEPIAEFDTREHLAAATAAGQVRWVILRRRDLEGLELPANIVAEEPSHPWEDAAEWRTKAVLLRPQGKRGKSLY
jgi:hypothetical protein